MLILLRFLIFFDFDFLTEGGADMWLTPPPQNAVVGDSRLIISS